MFQISNSYTLSLPSGEQFVVGNDNLVTDWVGWLENVTTTVNVRESINEKAEADGASQGANYLSFRSIVMDVYIHDANPVIRANRIERLSKIHQTLRSNGLLSWREANGMYKQIGVRMSGFPAVVSEDGPGKKIQITMTAANPTIVSQKIQAVEANPSTTMKIVNVGNAPAYPLIWLHGGASSVQIENQTTNQILKATYTVATGHYVEIDAYRRTVKYDGTANIFGSLDLNNADFFSLDPGVNNLVYTVTGSSGSPHARVEWRHSYL